MPAAGAETGRMLIVTIGAYSKLLVEGRNEARQRLAAAARRVGANAVAAMRFYCGEIGDVMTQIAVYGPAVTLSGRAD